MLIIVLLGLLHHPPDEVKTEMKNALLSCVEEMEGGARVQALYTLRDILRKYTEQ